ncbi:MAG TPA: heme-binding protein [Steroidobacteraceae bacterium]|nr:heme-binding protein [Steroidobacteraceae bacterium]
MTLNYGDARRALEAISTELTRRALPAVITVADDHGELIALMRMDGAPLSALAIATNKAWTAARERRPSFEVGRAARHPETGFEIAYYGDRRMTGWGGGVPVVIAGAVAGAVAVSGAPEAVDMEMAALGVAAILQGRGGVDAPATIGPTT